MGRYNSGWCFAIPYLVHSAPSLGIGAERTKKNSQSCKDNNIIILSGVYVVEKMKYTHTNHHIKVRAYGQQDKDPSQMNSMS